MTVRVAPKASRDAIAGVMPTQEGQALKVAVTAPADKGKANAAVIALLARAFDTAKSNVAIVSGETDRRKIVRISGDPQALAARAEALAGGSP